MPQWRQLANRPALLLHRIAGGDSAACVLLVAAAAAALACANSPLAGAYRHLFHDRLAWTPVPQLATWQLWIGDGLMAVFFFAVGLEIKRELFRGELAMPAQRRLPVLAAAAGMAAPAAVFLVLTAGNPELRPGWAIPAATDIAFAVGVFGLLGRRVPSSLRLFLLSVAIIDDLVAVAIIAAVYTGGIDPAWCAAALAIVGGMAALNRLGATSGWAYGPAALALWYCTLHSGVHPAIAGVAAAFTVPMKPDAKGGSLLLRMENALVPWVGYAIVPLYGFANAGVPVLLPGKMGPFAPLPLAIAAGLVIGKQAGIFGAILACDRSGFAMRPAGANWAQIWGASLLCGIGFTMSLFIAALAFPVRPELVEEAKLGVLAGSLVSAVLGYAVLRFATQETGSSGQREI